MLGGRLTLQVQGQRSLPHSVVQQCHTHCRVHREPSTQCSIVVGLQALAEVPAERAGWLLFVDQDVLVDEMAFTLPFKQYADVDLVLWGSRKLIAEDAYQKLLSVSHKDRQQGAPPAPHSMQPCIGRSRRHLLLHRWQVSRHQCLNEY